MKKLLKWIGIVSFVTILVLVFAINIMMTWYDSTDRIVSFFNESGVEITVSEEVIDSYKTRLLLSHIEGDKESIDKKVLVFVHGAPGGAMDFKAFMKDTSLLAKYDIISIDRLGYGASENDKKEYSIVLQTKIIIKQLKPYLDRDMILIGHSYGAPIVAYLGTQLKNKPLATFLWAPVIDPENEDIFWYSTLTKYIPFRWIFPKSFEIASYEKVSHSSELKIVEKYWGQINFPIIHVHGLNDRLAPTINLNYTKSNISSLYLSQEILPNAGHLLPFLNFEEMVSLIEKYDL